MPVSLPPISKGAVSVLISVCGQFEGSAVQFRRYRCLCQSGTCQHPYIGSVKSVSASSTDQLTGTKLYLIYRSSEYSYLFRDAKNSTAYSTLRSGPWMVEVKDHIESTIAGSSVKYRHNISHDGSMAALLGFLQIDQMVWPGKHILER
jgi:hypothetical protein